MPAAVQHSERRERLRRDLGQAALDVGKLVPQRNQRLFPRRRTDDVSRRRAVQQHEPPREPVGAMQRPRPVNEARGAASERASARRAHRPAGCTNRPVRRRTRLRFHRGRPESSPPPQPTEAGRGSRAYRRRPAVRGGSGGRGGAVCPEGREVIAQDGRQFGPQPLAGRRGQAAAGSGQAGHLRGSAVAGGVVVRAGDVAVGVHD